MRRPSSIGGRLRTGFALFVVLLAASGVFVYLGFAHQEGAGRQLNNQMYLLQHYISQLDGDFTDGQLAVANYELTFEHRFLYDYDADGGNFAADLIQMRRYAPPHLRGLIDRQERAGQAWFTLANAVTDNPSYAATDTKPTDKSWVASQSFGTANSAMAASVKATVNRLVRQSNSALSVGLAWSAGALVVAIALGLAIAAGTVRRTLGPLRRLTATVNRLTAGDQDARIQAAGPQELQDVARAVNALADESGRLREKEALSNRLRVMARAVGFRIREHLHADDVIRAAREALEENLDTDAVYLHVLRDGKLGPPEGRADDWILPGDFMDALPERTLQELRGLLKSQASRVIQDLAGPGGDQLLPAIRDPMVQAGIVSHLLTPFGVADELLGVIAADRLHAGHPWTDAEVSAVEAIAADLGRGLHHARLYEEENRLVEELKSVDRAKSDFVATVSHELRTPLTSIAGRIEMLLDRDLGELNTEQERTLETVSRNAARLQDLIEDLLTLSAIEAGTFTTASKPTDLLDIIAMALEDAAPAVASKGVTLTSALPSESLVVNGDAGQLTRVLTNLLSNAVKFTPSGGQVTVTAETDGGQAVVSVADTGIGIPAGDRKDLFTRFFRASNATKRAIPGTGLGLAIVQTIVVGHGGEMSLQSQEGEGTTVSVRLPLAESVGSAQPRHEADRRRAAPLLGSRS
jgi:two-component system phosphate regulon sensor histidine kinase PhoR